MRLDRVHADLRFADPVRTTVAEVARAWGFRHLGRFSASSAARSGEYLSGTLQG